MQLAWKQISCLGFILLLLFSGCAEKEPAIEELVVQAETLMDAGQIEGAILILERCLERAPERVDVLEALAFGYAANGDPMLASMTFARIAEMVPDRPEYYLYAAESLMEAGDAKGAVSQYETYLNARPQDRAVWVALADLQVSQGQLNGALEALLAAEQIEPRAVQRIQIAELYLQKNNIAQAQAWFGRALEGGAEVRDEALLGLLETAIRSKRFADGEALLAQLDAEYPGRLDQSDMNSVRGQLAEWRQRQDTAKEAAAALDKPRLQITRNPAAAGQAATAPPPSESAVETPAAPPPQEPVAAVADEAEPGPGGLAMQPIPPQSKADDLLGMARSKRAVGETAEAIRYYKQSLINNDAQPLVWAELSDLYLETGNDRWAQATASEAMRRDPDNPKLVLQYLRAGQRIADSERLIEEMEAAYRRFPDQLEIIVVLGRAYADQGIPRNARLLFKKFLDIAPVDHPMRPAVEEELYRLGR